MSLSIGSSSNSSNYINQSQNALKRSQNELSSGLKINSSSDDAGGLAVHMKLAAAIKRAGAVDSNVANSQSYLQSQDGGLGQASDILNRISELKTRSEDITLSESDKAAYDAEFTQLKDQLSNLSDEKFNDVNLYGSESKDVSVSEDGSQSVSVDEADLSSNISDILSAGSLNDFEGVDAITDSIQNVATLRATNGAQQNSLEFAAEQNNIKKLNTEKAASRIIDADIADASTRYAQNQVKSDFSIALASQAHASSQTALQLLG